MASSTTPAKAPPRGTPTQAEMVAAGLALIDAHGLDKFSINALATAMGAFQPNMYRRISNRQELLDLISDAIMAEAGLPAADPADWQAWLVEWAVLVRRAWHRHPRAGGLIYHGGPVARGAVEAVAGVLVRSFAPEFLGVAAQAYLAYVFGTTLLETRGLAPSTPVARPELEHSPNMLEFARAGAAGSSDPELVFLQGLQLLLDGFALHVR